ncbi:MAG: hydroxymethylbilane synthase [Armatimonadetes bacterium]|nr:hydroxymethylbilane synthase [Armatimonadota bacterium]
MPIIIGTRGSALALWQAHAVQAMLQSRYPELDVRLEIIHTTGDKILDTPLSNIGDKGLFTKELEVALMDGRIHLAVHSLKDLPTVLPDGLTLAAVTERERPEDALIAPAGTTIATLPHGGTVATGSLRRRSQLLHLRPDLNVVDVRGNVPTRLQKYQTNGWDGMILAYAGLYRLGLAQHIAQIIPTDQMIPAVGQAALGLETRADDTATIALLRGIEHPPTRICTDAERALLRRLEGGCQTPIAAHATLAGNQLTLHAMVASLDGSTIIASQITGSPDEAEELGNRVAGELIERGGKEMVEGIRGSR